MKFEIHRNLENNIFATKVVFKEFGGKDLEPKEEKELVNDFGAPTINLGKIDFEGFVKKGEKGIEISEDGTKVSFVLNAKTINIDESFRADLKVDPKKIDFITVEKDKEEEELIDLLGEGNKEIDENILIAEAACLIFEDRIKDAIEKELKKLKELYTNFEKETPIEFTV